MSSKKIFLVFAVLLAISAAIKLFDESKISTIQNVKVKLLREQQIIKGNEGNLDTEIRYLIITDKETFICKNSFINGKYNNSDVFFNLKVDSIYTLKVCGIGKTFFTDYRNVLGVKNSY
jgi:hypothetical protein